MNHSQAPEIFQKPISELDLTGLPPKDSAEFDQAVITRYALEYASKGWNAVVTVDNEFVRVVAVPEHGIDPKNMFSVYCNIAIWTTPFRFLRRSTAWLTTPRLLTTLASA